LRIASVSLPCDGGGKRRGLLSARRAGREGIPSPAARLSHRRSGVPLTATFAVAAFAFVLVETAIIVRVPVQAYVLWASVAASGAMTVLSFAILREFFPKKTRAARMRLSIFFTSARRFCCNRRSGSLSIAGRLIPRDITRMSPIKWVWP
jgi:hypothetical protein